MNDKSTDFPQYRKLSNGKVFYRITGERSFDEVQIIGAVGRLFTVKAEQYPEMLRIQDMLSLTDGFEISGEKEFDEILARYALS